MAKSKQKIDPPINQAPNINIVKHYTPKELCNISQLYSEGRIISLLEGGYNLHLGLNSSLCNSVSYHLQALKEHNNKMEFCKKCLKENDKKESSGSSEKNDDYSESYLDKETFLNKKTSKEYEKNLSLFEKSKQLKILMGYKYDHNEYKEDGNTKYALRKRDPKPNFNDLHLKEVELELTDKKENDSLKIN